MAKPSAYGLMPLYQRAVTGGWYTTLVWLCRNSIIAPSVSISLSYNRFISV
ncbi:hypothetical protein D3C72_2426660 [compost metagenome]